MIMEVVDKIQPFPLFLYVNLVGYNSAEVLLKGSKTSTFSGLSKQKRKDCTTQNCSPTAPMIHNTLIRLLIRNASQISSWGLKTFGVNIRPNLSISNAQIFIPIYQFSLVAGNILELTNFPSPYHLHGKFFVKSSGETQNQTWNTRSWWPITF